MTDERLAQIRELAEKAQFVPWEVKELLTLLDEQKKRIEELAKAVREECRAKAEAIEKLLKATKDDPGFDETTEIRWQNRIYKLLLKRLPPDTDECRIDGAGCESGDALDVTEHEISQAITEWENKAEAAEARASRAEQALKEAHRGLESLTPSGSEFVGDVKRCVDYAKSAIRSSQDIAKRNVIARQAAESALTTERERVIQECAGILTMRAGYFAQQSSMAESTGADDMSNLCDQLEAELTAQAAAIRALSSLPTPPQQTRTKTWAYDTGLRLYICGVCDYAGDTEDEIEEHDCHVSPPEEEKA